MEPDLWRNMLSFIFQIILYYFIFTVSPINKLTTNNYTMEIVNINT